MSCASQSRCVAVGGATLQHAFTDVWNGHKWQLHAISNQLLLLGVSCPSATFCLAVGHTSVQAHSPARQAVAMIWNGSSWLPQALPAVPGAVTLLPGADPAGDGALLTGVRCVASRCMVVGFFETNAGGSGALAEQWDGHSWTVLTTRRWLASRSRRSPAPPRPAAWRSGWATAGSRPSAPGCPRVGTAGPGRRTELTGSPT